MAGTQIGEVVEVFKQAHNINAAIKKLLKQEVRRGSSEERFFKDFRNVVVSPRAADLLEPFIERHYASEGRYFMVVAGYLYDEAMVDISGKIIDRYADDFNTTYEQRESEIEIKDEARFAAIAKEALKLIEEGLTEHHLPTSGFLKQVLVNRLFNPEVIRELDPIMREVWPDAVL